MIKEQFSKKLYYNNVMSNYNLIDLSGSKFTNYGFVMFDQTVVPKQDKIVEIAEYKNQFCLENVYSSFKNIYYKLEKDSLKNLISLDSMFNINKFEIIKSYQQPLSRYKNYLKNLYQKFVLFSRTKKIKDFSDFFENLKLFIVEEKNTLTYSSFLRSGFCNIYCSGLVLKYTNKSNEEILEDPSFEYFNNICNLNNFFLEKNDLSRIIFVPKIQNMNNHKFVYNFDLYMFIVSIFTLYNYYYNDFLFNKIENSKNLSPKQIINFFVKAKLTEGNKIFSKTTIDQTLKEIYFLLGLQDVTYVTRMIHKLSNDPTITKETM